MKYGRTLSTVTKLFHFETDRKSGKIVQELHDVSVPDQQGFVIALYDYDVFSPGRNHGKRHFVSGDKPPHDDGPPFKVKGT